MLFALCHVYKVGVRVPARVEAATGHKAGFYGILQFHWLHTAKILSLTVQIKSCLVPLICIKVTEILVPSETVPWGGGRAWGENSIGQMVCQRIWAPSYKNCTALFFMTALIP